ncbi:hypothetical protein J1N35_042831 [Gossypium stocksii]|uniref:Uncharacterized protein n=1 Tax=Gossypium stocksii TaxID=47602 RepID=A0A9D3U6A9_9ROSI|nr:hypothetical protein J1N35_042831 [Gossypium stocksii]
MLSRTRVRALRPWYILVRFQTATQMRFRIAKAQLMIMSSPNRVRVPLLNPSPITPIHKLGVFCVFCCVLCVHEPCKHHILSGPKAMSPI